MGEWQTRPRTDVERGSGLRIRHTDPTVRGCIVIVPVQKNHLKKIPIHVDGTGHSIVSSGVWADLQTATRQGHNHGFVISHIVKKAPDVLVGLGADPEFKPTKQLIDQAIRDIAPVGTRVTISR